MRVVDTPALLIVAVAVAACDGGELARTPFTIDLDDGVPIAAQLSTGIPLTNDNEMEGTFAADRATGDCTGLDDGTVTFDTASVVFDGGYEGVAAQGRRATRARTPVVNLP